MVGHSHLFGYPDLPANVDIPAVVEDGEEFALTLVCQINLSDLPDNDVFPKQGLLQFYADIAYYRGDWDEPAITMVPSDNKVCRVVYIPADQMDALESCRERYFEQDETPAMAIEFDRDKGQIEDPELQLLGKSAHLEWESWPEPCEDWQLLLQIDSMEIGGYSYNFIDWGVLCFLIDPNALKRLDFSDVRAIILST